MTDRIKSETPQENEIELNLMEEQAKQWDMPKSAYKGNTNDIDLHRDWFCPHCLIKLEIKQVVVHNNCMVNGSYYLKGDIIYETLECPSHYEICEYSFHNKELRRLAKVWWDSGFQFPLSPTQAHQARIDKVKESIARNQSLIDSLQVSFIQKTKKLRELESQIVED